MKRVVLTLTATLSMGLAPWASAQTAGTTGEFLGQKINPVLAVELEASAARAPSSTTASPAATPTVREPGSTNAGSAPMYTGVANTQSMGASSPAAPERERLPGSR